MIQRYTVPDSIRASAWGVAIEPDAPDHSRCVPEAIHAALFQRLVETKEELRAVRCFAGALVAFLGLAILISVVVRSF